jgi:tetratricopeptide (TPR) repeat protein
LRICRCNTWRSDRRLPAARDAASRRVSRAHGEHAPGPLTRPGILFLFSAVVALGAWSAAGAETAAAGASAQSPAPAGSGPEIITLDGAAAGQPETITPTPGLAALPSTGQGVNARAILADLWFKHQSLRQRGAATEAAALVDVAIGFMQREGVRAAPEIADAFLAEGRRQRRDGDLDGAIESHRLALRFDPDRFDSRLALATLLLRSGRGISEAFGLLKDGAKALLTDPEAAFYLSGAVLVLLYLGACGGLALALLLLTVRYRVSLAHDLQERFARRVGAASAPLVAAAILALPLVLPLPLTWALSFWGALLLPYMGAGDRTLAAAALVMLLCGGAFGSAVAWQMDTATDPTARVLLQAARFGTDLRHEEALKRALRERRDDPVYPFLLGSAYRAGGRLDESMAMYRQVLALDEKHARAMVNLGNLHALRQEFSQAQALYHKAAETDPLLALAPFNSHRAYLETFDMEAADEALRTARRIDDPFITRLMARTGEGSERRAPQDCRYTAGELWGRALRLRLEPRAKIVRSAIVNRATVGAAVGLLALVLIPGLGLVPRFHPAGRCGRCGRAYCRRCQVAGKYPGYCSPCVHLFFLRDGLAPSVRDRKMEEVVRFRRRHYLKTRVLGLVLPGSGHVLGGRPLFGALLLVLWVTAAAGFVLRSRLLVPPGVLTGVATTLGLLLLTSVAALAWLGANLTRQDLVEED